ncbi:MAG: hypothetical protein K0Q73_8243 [Paenibacillus sp.]|jgi:hypothetical protein|nr:hypothetical protein [Paenibacillus sp.]
MRRKGLRYIAALMIIFGLVAGMASNVMAGWGGTYLISPTGYPSNPGVYNGSIQWIQDSTTSHFVVTVFEPSTNTTIYSTTFIAQTAPVGATSGSFSIPSVDLWTIPTGVEYELSVSTWNFTSSGWTLIGVDTTIAVF